MWIVDTCLVRLEAMILLFRLLISSSLNSEEVLFEVTTVDVAGKMLCDSETA